MVIKYGIEKIGKESKIKTVIQEKKTQTEEIMDTFFI